MHNRLMKDIRLYSYRACPFARRTRMTLAEKSVDYELVEIDLRNKPDDFAQISPYGKVPVLLHTRDGHAGRLYESAIINEYLNDVFPEPPLLPDDPFTRAQARIWMDYCDSKLSGISWQFMQAGDDEEKLAAARNALHESLLFIEQEGLRKLGDGPYWLGERLSLVDIQFMPFLARYAEEPGAAEVPTECTRLKAWLQLMATRDSVVQTAA